MSIKVKSLGLVKNEEIEIKAVASLEVDGMKIDGIRVNESEMVICIYNFQIENLKRNQQMN